MIDRTHPLPMVRQCQLLALATAYYQPTLVASADLALMRRIDALHLAHPFAGANAAGPLAEGRPCDWAAARRDSNEVLIAKKL